MELLKLTPPIIPVNKIDYRIYLSFISFERTNLGTKITNCVSLLSAN